MTITKQGRPPRTPYPQRIWNVRLTQDEYDRLKDKATHAGLTMTEWVRRKITE